MSELLKEANKALESLLDQRDALTARVAELEGALKFYADKNSWRSPTIYMCGHRGKAQVDIDGGERARAALAKKPPDAL